MQKSIKETKQLRRQKHNMYAQTQHLQYLFTLFNREYTIFILLPNKFVTTQLKNSTKLDRYLLKTAASLAYFARSLNAVCMLILRLFGVQLTERKQIH